MTGVASGGNPNTAGVPAFNNQGGGGGDAELDKAIAASFQTDAPPGLDS